MASNLRISKHKFNKAPVDRPGVSKPASNKASKLKTEQTLKANHRQTLMKWPRALPLLRLVGYLRRPLRALVQHLNPCPGSLQVKAMPKRAPRSVTAFSMDFCQARIHRILGPARSLPALHPQRNQVRGQVLHPSPQQACRHTLALPRPSSPLTKILNRTPAAMPRVPTPHQHNPPLTQ